VSIDHAAYRYGGMILISSLIAACRLFSSHRSSRWCAGTAIKLTSSDIAASFDWHEVRER
jgi:hypothetical protein